MEKLIINIAYFQLSFEHYQKILISESFLDCANVKLSKYFELNTGLNVNMHIKLSSYIHEPINLLYNSISSSFECHIVVAAYGNPVKICWKSKSGIIYKLTDEVIDCNDIEFWIEGLDAKLYHQQMYPKVSLPFKFKDLPFELEILRLYIECVVIIEHHEPLPENIKDKYVIIDQLIGKGIEKGYGGGYIHNFKSTWEGATVTYTIDVGSVGIVFIKKIVQKLKEIEGIKKVTIT
jgi:hypothetical protein